MADNSKPDGPRSPDQPTHPRLEWLHLRPAPECGIGIREILTNITLVPVEDWEAGLNEDLTSQPVARRVRKASVSNLL